MPVGRWMTPCCLVKAHQQTGHGGLASAAGAHDGHCFTSPGMKADTLEHGLRQVITEHYVVEINSPRTWLSARAPGMSLTSDDRD